jgi:hypothetical protein
MVRTLGKRPRNCWIRRSLMVWYSPPLATPSMTKCVIHGPRRANSATKSTASEVSDFDKPCKLGAGLEGLQWALSTLIPIIPSAGLGLSPQAMALMSVTALSISPAHLSCGRRKMVGIANDVGMSKDFVVQLMQLGYFLAVDPAPRFSTRSRPPAALRSRLEHFSDFRLSAMKN